MKTLPLIAWQPVPLFLAEKAEAGVAASHARWTAGAQGNGCEGGF